MSVCSSKLTALLDSAASWHVSSVFLVRAHYPRTERAPSIDNRQQQPLLSLPLTTGEPGQCKAEEWDSKRDIWLRIQLLTVKGGSVCGDLFVFLPSAEKSEQKSFRSADKPSASFCRIQVADEVCEARSSSAFLITATLVPEDGEGLLVLGAADLFGRRSCSPNGCRNEK